MPDETTILPKSPPTPAHGRLTQHSSSTTLRPQPETDRSQAAGISLLKHNAGDSTTPGSDQHQHPYAHPNDPYSLSGSQLVDYQYSNPVHSDGRSYEGSQQPPGASPRSCHESHPSPHHSTQLTSAHSISSDLPPQSHNSYVVSHFSKLHSSMPQQSASRTSLMTLSPDPSSPEAAELQPNVIYSGSGLATKKRRRESTPDLQNPGGIDDRHSPSGSQPPSVTGPSNAGSAKEAFSSTNAAMTASGSSAASKRTKTQRGEIRSVSNLYEAQSKYISLRWLPRT